MKIRIEPQPLDGTAPAENYRAIRDELIQYNPALGDRPEIVAVSKADLPEAEDVRDQLSRTLNREVHLISAVTGQGLNTLLGAVAQSLGRDAEEAWG